MCGKVCHLRRALTGPEHEAYRQPQTDSDELTVTRRRRRISPIMAPSTHVTTYLLTYLLTYRVVYALNVRAIIGLLRS